MSASFALYLHVPFCGQRCAYCHFQIKVFHPSTDPVDFYNRYTDAVITEMAHYAKRYPDRMVTSFYAGGGTPSRLPLENWQQIFEAVRRSFSVHHDAEITVEVNPEDGSTQLLHGLRTLGVNRISFGVQTFRDEALNAIGRPHNRARALSAIEAAQGFSKGRSLDFILGLPFQTPALVKEDLDLIIQAGVEHVSLYLLERDMPTPIDKLAVRLPFPDEDEQADYYDLVHAFLTAHRFEHYEISNFAKPGFASVHNRTYWQCGDYLGLGPAAHGRVGNFYTRNHGMLHHYLPAVAAKGHGTEEQEHWTAERMRQEHFIQGMRLSEGVEDRALRERERKALKTAANHGLVDGCDGRWRLTQRGRLLANEVFEIFLGS